MTDAREIAKGLTKAQRDLLFIAAAHDHVVTYNARDLYAGGLVRCLTPFGHGKNDDTTAFTITPLGLAVKAILEGPTP